MQKDTFEVLNEQEGERLDKYLSDIYPELSRSFFQKLIKENNIQVNGSNQKSNYRLKTDDIVEITIPDAVETPILPQDIPLDILYEDDDVLVVNKPKGMVVHPSAGHLSGTLVNAILYHCQGHLSGINGVMRPGIVHRIDMDTTGAILVCKNDFAHKDLAEQLKEHTIKRRYRAIVSGNLKEDTGRIEGPIGRHPIDRKKMAINYKNGKDKYRVFAGEKIGIGYEQQEDRSKTTFSALYNVDNHKSSLNYSYSNPTNSYGVSLFNKNQRQ